jgi:hypothetical protein
MPGAGKVHDPRVLEYPGKDVLRELADVLKGADVVVILQGMLSISSLMQVC